MKDHRIKKAEKKLKIKRSDQLPNLVFWDKEPTAEELAELKERKLKPVKVKFI